MKLIAWIMAFTFFVMDAVAASNVHLLVHTDMRDPAVADDTVAALQCLSQHSEFSWELTDKKIRTKNLLSVVEKEDQVAAEFWDGVGKSQKLGSFPLRGFGPGLCEKLVALLFPADDGKPGKGAAPHLYPAPVDFSKQASPGFDELPPRENFLERNWPWLLGGAIVAAVALPFVLKKKEDSAGKTIVTDVQ